MRFLFLLFLVSTHLYPHGDHIPLTGERVTLNLSSAGISIVSGQTDSALQIYKNNELTHDSFIKRPLDDLDHMVVNSLIDQSYFIEFYDNEFNFIGLLPLRDLRIFTSHQDGKSEFINTDESWLYFQLPKSDKIMHFRIGFKNQKNFNYLQSFSIGG